jgi:cellulose synthase/poly-beta-1,6-N-acetylglucosamine synthase-like glycosyltransferase
MKAIFWISALFVAYVYAGYPLLLRAWAALARRRRERAGEPQKIPRPPVLRPRPRVSIVVAARNEAAALPGRIENLLSLEYPPDRREIIVVSDGSTDDTAAVLAAYSPDVRGILLPRVGKAVALNAGVRAARHELLVFADARQRFAPDALQRLVTRFADPAVGAVSGELVIDSEWDPAAAEASSVGEGVGLYWRYEKWIRRHESEVSSVVGATGAIYAVRRSLWRPLPPETILDDVLAPMRIVLAGHRVVFEPGALAFDVASPDAATERRRKVRTLAGNYQLVRLEPRLLWPRANPLFVQFLSHKLGRLLVPYALIALLVSNMTLASAGPIYSLALIAQVTFYVLALHGAASALPAPPSGEPPPVPVVAERGGAARASSRRKELVNAELD